MSIKYPHYDGEQNTSLIIPDKTESLKYNSIPNQQLTYANQLTLPKWNEYINVLRTQVNEAVAYIKKFNEWMFNPDSLPTCGWYDEVNKRLDVIKEYINIECSSRLTYEHTVNEDLSMLLHIYGVNKLHIVTDNNTDSPIYYYEGDKKIMLYGI